MNRKKTVLIDGTSMLKEAYYAVPANCVKGIRNVVVRIIEEKQTDYIAAVFGGMNENGIAARDLMDNEARLKETLASLKIPVFEKEGPAHWILFVLWLKTVCRMKKTFSY